MRECPHCAAITDSEAADYCPKCGASLGVQSKSVGTLTQEPGLEESQPVGTTIENPSSSNGQIGSDDSVTGDSTLLADCEQSELAIDGYQSMDPIDDPYVDRDNPAFASEGTDSGLLSPEEAADLEETDPSIENPEESSLLDESCYHSTNEIALPEEPSGDSVDGQISDEIATSPKGNPNLKAIQDEEREELISSLQAKVPSMVTRGRAPQDDPGTKIRISGSKSESPEMDSLVVDGYDDELMKQPNEQQDSLPDRPLAQTVPSTFNDRQPDDTPTIKGAAYFRKGDVHFPRGTSFNVGDEIKFRDKVFALRAKSRDLKTILLYGALGFVMVLLIASQVLRRGDTFQHPPLIGVVLEEGSRRVMPDVKVSLDDLGKTVMSNHNGVFFFEMIPEGSYTITGETPFFKTASFSFQHGSDGQTLIAIPMEKNTTSVHNEGQVGKRSEPEVAETPQFGDLKIKTNIKDAKIYLDNRIHGTGSKTIKRLFVGRHKLVVESDGYETFEQAVTVKSDETATVDVRLAKIKGETPPVPTATDYVRIGDSATAAGDPVAAAKSYSVALETEENPETYHRRAQVYQKIGKPAEAKKDFIKAGNLFASAGQMTSAIGAYNAVLSRYPNDINTLRARGYAYIQKGDYELALADFNSACELDGSNYKNRIGLGHAFSMIGKYKDAIKQYRKAENLTEDKSDVYALIALASLARGREKDARKYYERFSEIATPQTEKKYAADPEWQRLKQLASSD